ncbi:hypothetical protein OF83DRAFT_86117 [Amylostereum chailletii]|nr:hypothetical protein OF83DRAFT_86117 [Amylostereum chailletii]
MDQKREATGKPSLLELEKLPIDQLPAMNSTNFPSIYLPSADGSAPRRPQNCWIIYRSYRARQVVSEYGKLYSQVEISRSIAEVWRVEQTITKSHFRELYNQGKKQHAINFPDYRFRPQQPKGKINRRKKAKVGAGGFNEDQEKTQAGDNVAASPVRRTSNAGPHRGAALSPRVQARPPHSHGS